MSLTVNPGKLVRREEVRNPQVRFAYEPGKATLSIVENPAGSYQVNICGPLIDGHAVAGIYKMGNPTRDYNKAQRAYEGIMQRLESGATVIITGVRARLEDRVR